MYGVVGFSILGAVLGFEPAALQCSNHQEQSMNMATHTPLTDEQGTEAAIQKAGKTAPRITPAHIDGLIVARHFFTAADAIQGHDEYLPSNSPLWLLTFCVLTLRNGFTVTGESACASPENFDAGIGRDIAFKNAREKIWLLEGYLLKQRLCETPAPVASPYAPHQRRVFDEKAELDERLSKLGAFFETPIFKSLDAAERTRLTRQLALMTEFSIVLGERIAAFE